MNEDLPKSPAASNTLSKEDRILAALEQLDRRVARIEAAATRAESLAEAAPNAVATIVDSLDTIAARIGGDNVDARLRKLVTLLDHVTEPETLDALLVLADKAHLIWPIWKSMTDPTLLELVGSALGAVREARQDGTAKVSAFGLFRALGRPNVQRATGLLVHFLEHIGQSLEKQPMKSLPARA